MKFPNAVTIDASVFISSLVVGEVYHSQSQNFLRKVREQGVTVLIPMLTLFETLQGFYRVSQDLGKTDEVYQGFIDWNLRRQLVLLVQDASFLVYFTAHHHRFRLKTSDTVVALTARKQDCPLVTWDRGLIKAARAEVEVLTPNEFQKKYA